MSVEATARFHLKAFPDGSSDIPTDANCGADSTMLRGHRSVRRPHGACDTGDQYLRQIRAMSCAVSGHGSACLPDFLRRVCITTPLPTSTGIRAYELVALLSLILRYLLPTAHNLSNPGARKDCLLEPRYIAGLANPPVGTHHCDSDLASARDSPDTSPGPPPKETGVKGRDASVDDPGKGDRQLNVYRGSSGMPSILPIVCR